jgi:hypothetical protein
LTIHSEDLRAAFLTIKEPARKTRPVNNRLRKKRGMNLYFLFLSGKIFSEISNIRKIQSKKIGIFFSIVTDTYN